ncbi:MAG TPA: energy transducer TonB [Acidobacteriaceae bacterium]|nr:energy transducer TonB [Acidobacteriaceae bacterium]
MGLAQLKIDQLESEEERQSVEEEIRLRLCATAPVLYQNTQSGFLLASLLKNLRDALFPEKLPPLFLTSHPVAVSDPLAVKRSPASSILSLLLHAGLIFLAVWLVLHAPAHIVVPHQAKVTPITILPYIPLTPPAPKVMAGGGGGGAHQIVEANKGRLPRIEQRQVTPPQLLRIDHPKLAAQPAVVAPRQITIPDSSLPNMGAPQSPQVAVVSQGAGSNSGFGGGGGGGIGFGQGAGVGLGSGGGYGGGVMSVGAGVTAPVLVHSVQPEFTNQARQARHQGIVTLQLIVDSHGNTENIQVVRRLGMGLDEKAIEAVRQYKFKPAIYQGHPVPVRLTIDVTFHLY